MEKLPTDNPYIVRLATWADSYSLPGALLIAYSAGLARTALEAWTYLYPSTGGINTYLHFPISFLCFAVSLSWLVCYVANYPKHNGVKIALVMLPVIVLVPLIDIGVYGHHARAISYLSPEVNGVRQFIGAVFTRRYAEDISVGQLVVVHSAAIGAAALCWASTKRLLAAALAWLGVLAVIFFWATFPVTIRLVAGRAHQILCQLAVNLGGRVGHVHESCTILGSADAVSSAVYILALPVLVFGLASRRLRAAMLENLRLKRMAHYLLMLLLGMVLATKGRDGAIPLLAHPSNIRPFFTFAGRDPVIPASV